MCCGGSPILNQWLANPPGHPGSALTEPLSQLLTLCLAACCCLSALYIQETISYAHCTLQNNSVYQKVSIIDPVRRYW